MIINWEFLAMLTYIQLGSILAGTGYIFWGGWAAILPTHGSLKPIIVISSLKLTLLLLCLGRISILQSEESDESEVLP